MRKLIALFCLLNATVATMVWAEAIHEQKSTAHKATATPPKAVGPAVALESAPIHNGFRLGKRIISGSCPVGEAGFKRLAQWGVKTVISVDGARPDAALAQKFGMRYVHIPVTYAGITRVQGLSIARAVRDLPGPVFIHCHHGQHRGPTAAVIAAMVNEGWSIEQAESAMKQAGTSPRYRGLWAAVEDWKMPTPQELDTADASFPSAVPTVGMVAAMVNIDERWEHLSEVKAAQWATPPSHPDIDPPHEALLLREAFRELARTPQATSFPSDFMTKLARAEAQAAALEAALRGKDLPAAQKSFNDIASSCQSCHAAYRDISPAR